ncbi:hypothetical protein ABZ806_24125 [Spirillospora sp. NPDC047418]
MNATPNDIPASRFGDPQQLVPECGAAADGARTAPSAFPLAALSRDRCA